MCRGARWFRRDWVCDLFDLKSRLSLYDMIGKLPRIDILVANSGGPAPGMAQRSRPSVGQGV